MLAQGTSKKGIICHLNKSFYGLGLHSEDTTPTTAVNGLLGVIRRKDVVQVIQWQLFP